MRRQPLSAPPQTLAAPSASGLLSEVWVCISLVVSDAWRLFMHLFTIHTAFASARGGGGGGWIVKFFCGSFCNFEVSDSDMTHYLFFNIQLRYVLYRIELVLKESGLCLVIFFSGFMIIII